VSTRVAVPPFIDAHHHLWDLGVVRYPWLMARGVHRFFGDPTPIQRNYVVADLLDDVGALPLVDSAHIQVGVADGDEVAETDWLQSVAESPDSRGLPGAIVAFCDLARADAPAVLAAHLRSTRVRGVRQIVGRAPHDSQQSASDALIDDARFWQHLRVVQELDLSFDLQIVAGQAGRIAARLEHVPGLRVALCHCGSPWDQSAGGLAAWREALKPLANLPQVSCKLSGFGMFNAAWTVESIRPIIETCIELFGPARCMFGSNFPVEKLARDYAVLWEAYAAIAQPLPAADRQRLFAGTAAEFYRLAE
jgi:predicted TIM-barrel fold metal-dependent hydrolase